MDIFREFLLLIDINVPLLIWGLILFMTALVRFGRSDWPERFVNGENGTFLLAVSGTGMILLASAHNGEQLFIGMEMIVVAGTILLFIGHPSPTLPATEAALKFFLPGQLMAGLLLLAVVLPNGLGSLFALLSFGFMAGLVPVHFAQPDLAQAAPRGLAAYLLSGTKIAGTLAILRFLQDHPSFIAANQVVSCMAALSILLGGLSAAPQRNLRRMLGYVSVCQSGLIIGIISNGHILNSDWIPIEVALTAYTLALALAFHVLEILEEPLGGAELHRLAGLWERSPLCAGALSLALLSLAGFPPVVGMLTTYHVLEADWAHHTYLLMICLGVGQLAILYGFLNVAKQMFWSAPRGEGKILEPETNHSWLILLCILVIAAGLCPYWNLWGQVMK